MLHCALFLFEQTFDLLNNYAVLLSISVQRLPMVISSYFIIVRKLQLFSLSSVSNYPIRFISQAVLHVLNELCNRINP
jgi:hypothetical protein